MTTRHTVSRANQLYSQGAYFPPYNPIPGIIFSQLNYIILGAGLVNLAGALTLGRWYQPMGMAVSLVIAEACVVAGAFIFLKWKKLEPWGGPPAEVVL